MPTQPLHLRVDQPVVFTRIDGEPLRQGLAEESGRRLARRCDHGAGFALQCQVRALVLVHQPRGRLDPVVAGMQVDVGGHQGDEVAHRVGGRHDVDVRVVVAGVIGLPGFTGVHRIRFCSRH